MRLKMANDNTNVQGYLCFRMNNISRVSACGLCSLCLTQRCLS